MLDALIAGERDAKVLAELALGRMRSKRVELRPALAAARFRPHHAVMLGEPRRPATKSDSSKKRSAPSA